MKHLKKTNYRLTEQIIFQKYRKKILKKIKLNAYKLSIKEKPIKLINIKFKIFEKQENKAQKRLISKKNQRSIIKKFYKIIYLIILILANFMFFISQDCLAMIASESYQTSNKSKINIEENIIGLEFSSGFRFKLANDIFSDSLEITDKCYDQYQCQNNYQLSEISNNNFADNIFIEGEIFATKYLSKNINHSLGTRVNLGYNIKSFRIFASTGYLFTKVNYNLQNSENKNLKISQNKSLPFYGFGLGYDLTKNLSLRINSTFYQFDLSNPNISNSQSKISIKALSFGTAWHF